MEKYTTNPLKFVEEDVNAVLIDLGTNNIFELIKGENIKISPSPNIKACTDYSIMGIDELWGWVCGNDYIEEDMNPYDIIDPFDMAEMLIKSESAVWKNIVEFKGGESLM